jgi:hypothetical protein
MAVLLCSASFILSVTNKPFMLNVIMLSVIVPFKLCQKHLSLFPFNCIAFLFKVCHFVVAISYICPWLIKSARLVFTQVIFSQYPYDDYHDREEGRQGPHNVSSVIKLFYSSLKISNSVHPYQAFQSWSNNCE